MSVYLHCLALQMYRVFYTEDPARPLVDWQVKLVPVDGTHSQSDLGAGTSTLALLTHLRSNAIYYVRVGASNIKGDGPVSDSYPVIVRPGGRLHSLHSGFQCIIPMRESLATMQGVL